MATDSGVERVHLNTDQLTRAGIVGLIGLFVLGIAFLIASQETMAATRKWMAQQDRPIGESAKSVLDQLHTAAMAAANAGSESLKSSGSV